MDVYRWIKETVEHATHSLPPHRWDPVTINLRPKEGKRTSTKDPDNRVTAHDVGANLPVVWAYFTFLEAGQPRTVRGELDAAKHARVYVRQGEHDPADKGQEKKNARIAVTTTYWNGKFRIIAKLSFDESNGDRVEYRFDGTMYP
ncbi:MAG: hypothetical protein IT208_00410 [Chthonomonadales bacterium]|nr:hypothetical protein [Chthonomonadales bacterium]